MFRSIRTLSVCALVAATTMALPAHAGEAFITASSGLAHANGADGSGTAVEASGGYRWGRFGVEAGFSTTGNLDHVTDERGTDGGLEVIDSVDAWLLGANFRNELSDRWYLTARAGVMAWETEGEFNSCGGLIPPGSPCGTRGFEKSGVDAYAGAGVGYRMSELLDVGLSWRYQHLEAFSLVDSDRGISMQVLAATLEYRFR